MNAENSYTTRIIAFIVITLVVIALAIIVYYFYQLRSGKTLTASQITTGFVAAIIGLIILFVLWIVLLYYLFSGSNEHEVRRTVVHHDDIVKHHDVSSPAPAFSNHNMVVHGSPIVTAVHRPESNSVVGNPIHTVSAPEPVIHNVSSIPQPSQPIVTQSVKSPFIPPAYPSPHYPAVSPQIIGNAVPTYPITSHSRYG